MDANLTFRSVDLDETEEQVATGPNRIMSFQVMNLSEATIYLNFYDALIANVTVGVTVPKLTYAIAAGGGLSCSPPGGIRFNTGIAAAATTEINSDGAPGTNEVVLDVMYQP